MPINILYNQINDGTYNKYALSKLFVHNAK